MHIEETAPQTLIKSGSMGLSDTIELKWLDEKKPEDEDY